MQNKKKQKKRVITKLSSATVKISKNLTRLVFYMNIRCNRCLGSCGRHGPKVSTNNRIVSVVDDDIYITKLFDDALRQNIDGISVFSFNDPIMAFQHFTENKENYALVISDLRMPGLNGLELLKKVKTLNPNVRTILMSAYNFEEEELYQAYIKETLINSTIEKPVTMNRLYQIVREELNASAKIAK